MYSTTPEIGEVSLSLFDEAVSHAGTRCTHTDGRLFLETFVVNSLFNLARTALAFPLISLVSCSSSFLVSERENERIRYFQEVNIV